MAAQDSPEKTPTGAIGRVLALAERLVSAAERIAGALERDVSPRKASKRTPRLIPSTAAQVDQLAMKRAEAALQRRGYKT